MDEYNGPVAAAARLREIAPFPLRVTRSGERVTWIRASDRYHVELGDVERTIDEDDFREEFGRRTFRDVDAGEL